jgi:hypothetical protein
MFVAEQLVTRFLWIIMSIVEYDWMAELVDRRQQERRKVLRFVGLV